MHLIREDFTVQLRVLFLCLSVDIFVHPLLCILLLSQLLLQIFCIILCSTSQVFTLTVYYQQQTSPLLQIISEPIQQLGFEAIFFPIFFPILFSCCHDQVWCFSGVSEGSCWKFLGRLTSLCPGCSVTIKLDSSQSSVDF